MNAELHYHDTTNLNLKEKHHEELLAKEQDKFILEIFKASPNIWYTPFQIQEIAELNEKRMEITSVRRAITNLTDRGVLIKSEKAAFLGKFNKKNHGWKYNNGKLF